jgi:hypothetical protein
MNRAPNENWGYLRNNVGDCAIKMKLTATLPLLSATGCFAKVTIKIAAKYPKMDSYKQIYMIKEL